MDSRNRPTRFLLLADGSFDTALLASALTSPDHGAAEIEEVYLAHPFG